LELPTSLVLTRKVVRSWTPADVALSVDYSQYLCNILIWFDRLLMGFLSLSHFASLAAFLIEALVFLQLSRRDRARAVTQAQMMNLGSKRIPPYHFSKTVGILNN
jgi:hypothetical protein